MPSIPLVIIHGWSDKDDSFVPLAEAIERETNREVENIWLGNYISLDDDVRMKDLVRALNRAWNEKLDNIPLTDVIVHSTGGLIIRDWIDTYFTSVNDLPPIRNLVMLAPANFGSPLAHQGRAVIGRVLKGFRSGFETGTHILKALEMASPYTWELALRDRFSPNPFAPDEVRTTVIVGNTGYGGIPAIANKDGSDGTVYVSTANLNCAYLEISFDDEGNDIINADIRLSSGQTAFLVADDHNHSSVALKEAEHPGNQELLANIITALNIETPDEFNNWITHCEAETKLIMDQYTQDTSDDVYKHGYQNTVVYVSDNEEFDVQDYVIEFYEDFKKGIWDLFAGLFNTKAVNTVHPYSDNKAYRSFMINCTRLSEFIEDKDLRISVSALPDYNDSNNYVGYQTFESDDIGCLVIKNNLVERYFSANRTVLVKIDLTRKQKDTLFTLNHIDEVKNS